MNPLEARIVVLAALAVLVLLVTVLQSRYRFAQYAFFLRLPLLHTLVLLLLPLAVKTPFHNLFVVTPLQFAAIVFMLVINAWAVTYAWGLVFVGAAPRFGLKFRQPDFGQERDWDKKDVLPNRILALIATENRRTYGIPIVLSAPVVVWCIRESGLLWWQNAVAIGAGFALAVASRELSLRIEESFRRWLYKREIAVPAAQLFPVRKWIRDFAYRASDWWIGRAFVSALSNGYSNLSDDGSAAPTPVQERDSPFSHWRAAAFVALAFVLYVVAGFALDPAKATWFFERMPALVYLLLILTILGLLLPAVTFLFDFYRLPFVAVVVVVLLWSYLQANLDHYYEFSTEYSSVSRPLDAVDVVNVWHTKHQADSNPVMVVIATSGGGSHAARWTTEVLQRLRADEALGERFVNSISFVSAVSGGALGTMYALEQFGSRPPSADAMAAARDNASRSNVGALAWGMAYPDFVRKIFPVLFSNGRDRAWWKPFDGRRDRGWALEQTWRSRLAAGSTRDTLASWTENARAGTRPAVVFNATLMETGQRFLISRVRIPETSAEEFVNLYPDRDLSIVTAVRLSAAFPYLSPMARPLASNSNEGGKPFEDVAYHVADGGYYDGSGTLTAVEFLKSVVTRYRELGHRKVLLVEIRTARDPEKKAGGHTSWLAGLVEPLSTALSVSSSSQASRARFERDLLRERWNNCDLKGEDATKDKRVQIESVVFHFNGTGLLPWHLSTKDMTDISDAWGTRKNQEALKAAKTFFNGSPEVTDTEKCPASDNVAAERLPVSVVKDVRNVESESQATR